MGCFFSVFLEGSGIEMGAASPFPRRPVRVEESPLLSDELLWENTLPMRQLKWDFIA